MRGNDRRSSGSSTKGSSRNKCIKLRRYSDELYSSILRGTSRDEYLSLRSPFLTPWLLAGKRWCPVWPAPLGQSEGVWLKTNSKIPHDPTKAYKRTSS